MTIKEVEVKMQLGISGDDAMAAAAYILEENEGDNCLVLATLISKISHDKNRTFKNMNSIYSDLLNFTEKDIREYLMVNNDFYNKNKTFIDSIDDKKMRLLLAKYTVAVKQILA